MKDNINNNIHSVGEETSFDSSDISQLINTCLQYILLTIGYYLHFKIIYVCHSERNKTWLVQISHAIVTTIHFSIKIPFIALTHFVPNLSSYIGSWVCYVGAFNDFFAFQEITSHSLWVAIQKYILIVHTQKARAYGEKKLEGTFLLIHVIYPLIGSAIAMTTTNYETRSELKSCFGIEGGNIQDDNSSVSGRGNFLYCDVSEFAETSLILSHVVQFFCVSRTLTNFVVITNVPEAFLYYKIFKTMKR